jgi:hypothetical protein
MALYSIIRVYEVQADTQQQATDRMIEALTLHVEWDYHVKDVIRAPGAKPGQGKPVVLKPPAGWLSLIAQQLTGKARWAIVAPPQHQFGGNRNISRWDTYFSRKEVIPIISYTLVKCVIDDVDEVAAEPVKRYGKTQKWYRRITVHTESGEAFELLLEAHGKQPLELRRKSYFEWLIPHLFKLKNTK